MSMIGNVAAAADSDIAALRANPSTVMKFVFAAERKMDVDKAWHAIHYLLNGDAWDGEHPLDFWTIGGTVLSVLGYGPARGFTSAQVKEIAAALAPVDTAKLFERWNAKKMRKADIYGIDPDEREAEEEYVGDNFERLKRFISTLAREGQGMIVYVN
jgi:hypothetical protein